MQIKNDIISFKKTQLILYNLYYSSAKKIINIKLYPILSYTQDLF